MEGMDVDSICGICHSDNITNSDRYQQLYIFWQDKAGYTVVTRWQI